MSSEKNKVQVAWLSGGYHRRRAMLLQIREKFKGAELFVCDGSVAFEYLMTHMQSTGCFEESKLVIVNEMPVFKDSNRAKYIKHFKEVISELDESIFVVFNGISPTKEKALFTLVKEIGRSYEYPDAIDKKEAPRWLSDQFQKRGYSIDYKASEALVETCGYDRSVGGIGADMLEMSIDRIIRYLGEEKKVSLETVEATIFRHENFIVWDILNAVDDKNYERCVTMLSKVHLLDENVIQAISQLMSTMLWRFRMLLFLKESLAVLKDPNKVVEAAMLMRKLKRSNDQTGFGAIYSPENYASGDNEGKPQVAWTKNVVEGALNGFYGRDPAVNLYTRRDIYRIVRAIQNAILHIRGLQSESLAFLLADTVFMVACNVADDQHIKLIMDSFEKLQS
jgi:DNA polymerase III delta subunit